MGAVVHFEIPADDKDRAKGFYEQAFGWAITAIPGMDYSSLITAPTGAPADTDGPSEVPGVINGGLTSRATDLTHPVITLDVADIDATLQTVESLGGSTVKPKETIPGMGSFAYFKDTEGNVMGLWENLPAETSTAGNE